MTKQLTIREKEQLIEIANKDSTLFADGAINRLRNDIKAFEKKANDNYTFNIKYSLSHKTLDTIHVPFYEKDAPILKYLYQASEAEAISFPVQIKRALLFFKKSEKYGEKHKLKVKVGNQKEAKESSS